jgi:hypothetical protein
VNLANLNPDTPVPYALTPKALAALAAPSCLLPPDPAAPCGGCGGDDCPACACNGWACLACGDAYFGPIPDDGLCRGCRAIPAPAAGAR